MNIINLEQEFPDLRPQILAIAVELQSLVLRIFPAAETTFDGENAGYGFGSRYKDLVFVITPHRQRINLGIVNGASLEDPHGLMEGKGKVHRHVKLRKAEDVSDPNLEDLMEKALVAAEERMQPDT